MEQKTYNDVERMMLGQVQRDIQLSRAVLPVAGIASTDPKVISSQQPSSPTGLKSSYQGFATSSCGMARRRGSSVSLPFSATPQQTSVSSGTGTNPQYDTQSLLPSSSRSDPPIMIMASGSPGTIEVESLDGSPQYAETLFQYVLRRQSLPDTCTAKAPNVPTSSSRYVLAHSIKDFRSIEYPDGVQGPNLELNKYSEGRFRYDREFLLQFMSVCKEKPKSLPPLSAFGLESSMMRPASPRGGPGRRGDFAKGSLSSPTPLQATKDGIPGPNQSGTIAAIGRQSTMLSRPAIPGSSIRLPLGRPGAPMVGSLGQSGPGGTSIGKKRTRTKRDKKYSERKLPCQQPALGPGVGVYLATMFEPVAPPDVSAGRWVPTRFHLAQKPRAIDEELRAVVDRKIKSLLNKFTMSNFDSISDQIIALVNKCEKETDGRTLIQVVCFIFEQVVDDVACPISVFARLCLKISKQISPKIKHDKIRDSEGKQITGGRLFLSYLLGRCQYDFENGRGLTKLATEAIVSEPGESATRPYEYWKAKRQALDSVKFIGELCKLEMISERIVHECVKKLLGASEIPREEELEGLCKLLTTAGAHLDSPKARAHIGVYFSRIKELTMSPNVSARVRFMLQDVIELRERKWVSRPQNVALSTVDTDAKLPTAGTRRPAKLSGGPATRPPPEGGDLSQFGKIGKTGPPATFGPASIFANKKENKRESIGRTGSADMFFMLSQNAERAAAETQNASNSSRPSIREPNIGSGTSGTPSDLGTPTMTPAGITPTAHIAPSGVGSVTSPPSAPTSTTDPGAACAGQHAPTFVPRNLNRVVVRNELGLEVKLEDFKRHTT